jgi:hypothetical protein
MTNNQNVDIDEVHRLWTRFISDDIFIVEYSDHDFLISHNRFDGPWNDLLLKPHQMRALLDFSDAVESAGEASLGESIDTGQLTVRYEDGTYTLDPEERDDMPVLSESQMDAIHDLLDHRVIVAQD